jgi:hypothetical protein
MEHGSSPSHPIRTQQFRLRDDGLDRLLVDENTNAVSSIGLAGIDIRTAASFVVETV